jgi:hypothetical protein
MREDNSLVTISTAEFLEGLQTDLRNLYAKRPGATSHQGNGPLKCKYVVGRLASDATAANRSVKDTELARP